MRVAHLLVAAAALVSGAGLAGAEQPKAQMTPQQSAETIVELAQKKLAAMDLKPGPVNGIEHKQTQDAVKRFQKSQKLDVSGRLDAPTLTALGVRPATTVARSAPPSSTSPSSEQLSMIASVGTLPSDSGSAAPSESSSASPSESSGAAPSESSSPAQSESKSQTGSNPESSTERTAEPKPEQSQS